MSQDSTFLYLDISHRHSNEGAIGQLSRSLTSNTMENFILQMVLLSTVLAFIKFAVWTCRLLECRACGIWQGHRVTAKRSQPSLRILLPYRKSILESQVVFLCFWSFKNFLDSDTLRAAPGLCSKMTPSPQILVFLWEAVSLLGRNVFMIQTLFYLNLWHNWRPVGIFMKTCLLPTFLIISFPIACQHLAFHRSVLPPPLLGTEERSRRWFNPESPGPRTHIASAQQTFE